MARLHGADATKRPLRGVQNEKHNPSAAKRYFVALRRVAVRFNAWSWAIIMICIICKRFSVEPETATITLERGGMTLVVKHVLARVCPNCGEEYIDEEAAAQVMETAEQAFQSGIQVGVREYAFTA